MHTQIYLFSLLGYILGSTGKLTTLTYRPPPLLSRDSHTGYLTSSSPMIATTTADDDHSETKIAVPQVIEVPSTAIAAPETIDISPKASPALQVSQSTSTLP